MALAEQVARFAAALAEPTRAHMCLALLDGRAWTATELARVAGIAPSTASEHLDRLVDAGLLVQERQGRHRYLRLAGPEMAGVVEDLAALVTGSRTPPDAARAAPTSLRGVRSERRLAAGRTCYDHLAGALGVDLLDALVASGHLSTRDGITMTATGRDWFVEFLGAAALQPRTGRPLVRTCLDWTERRHHLGGALGASLCRELVDRAWVLRTAGDRAVTLTDAGRAGLADVFGTATRLRGWPRAASDPGSGHSSARRTS